MVLTGVSPTSIGATTAQAIAAHAPEALILASRTPSKLDAVASALATAHPTVPIHTVRLDLSSLDAVRAAAAQIAGLVDRVDVLINNAGINCMTRDPVRTPGDTEVDITFFTNHLGPFLFTHLLLPQLRASAAAAAAAASSSAQGKKEKGATRIVNLSSHGHHLSPVRFYDYQLAHYVYDGVPESQKPPRDLPAAFLRTGAEDGYPGFIGYGQSKTANILHALELNKRLRRQEQKQGDRSGENDILALSVHPGSIQTDLSRALDEDGLKTIEGTVAAGGGWKTLDQGAATTVVAAFDPKLGELAIGGGGGGGDNDDNDGKQEEVFGYMADCQLADGVLADWAKDPYNAQMLWHESERMLGVQTGL